MSILKRFQYDFVDSDTGPSVQTPTQPASATLRQRELPEDTILIQSIALPKRAPKVSAQPKISAETTPPLPSEPQVEGPSEIEKRLALEKALHSHQTRFQQDLKEVQQTFEADYRQKSLALRQEIENEAKQLRADIEVERKQALEKGYEEGLQRGKSEAHAELKTKAAEYIHSFAALAEEKKKILKKAKLEVLKLALAVAEQIVKNEVSLNQAVCMNIVAEAITKVTDKDRVVIRANRSETEYIKMHQERIYQHLGEVKNLSIQEDPRVDPGGVIVETNLGYIDATIATKLETLKSAMMHVYEEEEAADLLRAGHSAED